jgi:GGDEF domain-containing protein
MPEPLNLSQSAWILLDLLQQQLGVTLEVLDSSMRPLLSATGGDAPASTLDQPGVVAEITKSLKTGEMRLDRSRAGLPVGIFPIRLSRRIVGCLLVVPRPTRLAGTEPTSDATLEGIGHLARTALEADLALTEQLADTRYRIRRVHGILRFLLQLGGENGESGDERDTLNAVIQAGTVWFDLDCRIYHRQADGSYLLVGMLPGAEPRNAGVRIEAIRAEKLLAARRFPSGSDLEELGLGGRRDEVLVLPVGISHPTLMLVVAGSIDQEVELTFGAIARVLGGVLQARELARVERWQQRLAAIPPEPRRAPERIILNLLEALARESGAVGARVTLVSGGEERVLAALGQPMPAGEAGPAFPEPPPGPADEGARSDEISQTIAVTPDASIRLSLRAPAERLTAVAIELASWMTALRPWLHDAVSTLTGAAALFETATDISAFEQRIREEVERAKRFNLGLGLVLIGPAHESGGEAVLQTLIEMVRPELRASDLMGRVRGDLAAIVLVHAEAVGADSVMARLRQRLESGAREAHVSSVQLGKAVFTPELASADALIAQALRDAERLELRN